MLVFHLPTTVDKGPKRKGTAMLLSVFSYFLILCIDYPRRCFASAARWKACPI